MGAVRRHENVINLDELDGREAMTGTNFGSVSKRLAAATGAKGIGCSHYEVPVGRTAFPRHFHCANEESLFVLDGEGELKIGDDVVTLRPGDYVTFPVGPQGAHQLWARGDRPLRYLCFSTLHPTEVVGYPDSKKIGALAGESYKKALSGESWLRHLSLESSMVGYFDGEDIGEEPA